MMMEAAMSSCIRAGTDWGQGGGSEGFSHLSRALHGVSVPYRVFINPFIVLMLPLVIFLLKMYLLFLMPVCAF